MSRLIWKVVLIASLSLLVNGQADDSVISSDKSTSVVAGITQPYHIATLGFVSAGRIATIRVKEGDQVQVGQELVELDSSIQKLKVQIAKVVSDAMKAAVKLSAIKMDLAKKELDRISKLAEQNAASSIELEHAAQNSAISAAKYQKAMLMYENALKSYELEQLKLKELTIRAPFSGFVSKIFKSLGESVDKQEGILTLVQINPIKVSVDCPLELAGGIKINDKYLVKPADNRWKEKIGKVIFVSPSADAASQTFRVKLLVDNQNDEWFAGIKVYVDFSKKVEK